MRPKLLTSWWLRAAYILFCTGVGAGIAVVARLPIAVMVCLCAGLALLRIAHDARKPN
jgi:hypothetical protein